MYQIRAMRPNEWGIVSKLNEQFFHKEDTECIKTKWWVALRKNKIVAYSALKPSGNYIYKSCYLYRVAVLPKHRGNSLQARLTKAMLVYARKNGFHRMITDTRFNTHSSNNMIKCGFTLFDPVPWAFPDSLYWIKEL